LLSCTQLRGACSCLRGTTDSSSTSPKTESTSDSIEPCTNPDDCRTKCDHQLAAACSKLGIYYDLFEGDAGVPVDLQQAMSLYRKGCEGGDGDGCISEADHYDTGEGVALDVAKANSLYDQGLKLLQQACDANQLGACMSLSLAYRESADPKDYQKNHAINEKLCNMDSSQCGSLALEYAYGSHDVVPKDSARAIELFEKGCEAKQVFDCKWAAEALLEKNDVTSQQQAQVLLTKALALADKDCQADHENGCEQASKILELMDKNGSRKAEKEAFFAARLKILRAQCNETNNEGCTQLALAYRFAEDGLPQDLQRAAEILHQACERHSAYDCAREADLYFENADDYPGRMADALVPYARACDFYDAVPCARLARLLSDDMASGHFDLPTDIPRAKALAPKAVALVTHDCNRRDDFQACYELGMLLNLGLGVPADLAKGSKLISDACERGAVGKGCDAEADVDDVGEDGHNMPGDGMSDDGMSDGPSQDDGLGDTDKGEPDDHDPSEGD
jgi:TPR repeat protein